VPAFPGLKMGLGAAEHSPLPPAQDYWPEAPPARMAGGWRWQRLAFWLVVAVAAALIAWLLLA
jgi:hypothetical protein